MRIISQDTSFDMPYERCAIYISKDSQGKFGIFADMDSCCNCIRLGTYSTEELAYSVMRKILSASKLDNRAFVMPLEDGGHLI